MRKLADSSFQSIVFDEELSLLTETWKPESENMTSEIHLAEVHSVYLFMRKNQPRCFLSDIRELRYELSKNEQEFVGNLFKDNTARCVAIVTSHLPTIASNVESTLQQLESEVSSEFRLRYFATTEEAQEWLLACSGKQ